MAIRNLSRGIAALLLIGGLSACQTTTNVPPWDLPKPAGMTKVHQENAVAARAVQERLPEGSFSHYDPTQVNWDDDNGFLRTVPMSNMTVADLTSLVTGKYHIVAAWGRDRWSVRYYAPDGTTHFCRYEHGQYREYRRNRYVVTAAFGLASMFHRELDDKRRTDNTRGWPKIADPDKGLLFVYGWSGRKWVAEPGWIQKEYAAAFAKRCPNLPRVAEVNNDQLGTTIDELRVNAMPVTGFRTAFENDPEDPLTAEMYYRVNAPE